jgi:hypothetical protein
MPKVRLYDTFVGGLRQAVLLNLVPEVSKLRKESQQTHVTNNVAIAEIKIKHEPAEPVAPSIIIPTKEHVHNLLISHASLTLGQRDEEHLLRFKAIVIFTAVGPVAGTNPQFHLIVS